jgi:Delta7-sterol 5-desaturase
MTKPLILSIIVIALCGYLMAAFEVFWAKSTRNDARIYQSEISRPQVMREALNSLYSPVHAAFLAGVASQGFFPDRSVAGFLTALLMTYVWAEIWHYASHRAFHTKALYWIHREHHKSRINGPLTSISFSFLEKVIFDIGMFGPLMLVDRLFALNIYGIATWFLAYIILNAIGHRNYEFRKAGFITSSGRLMTSTVFHALHHGRFVGNYGLGTRVLDRLFGTEWSDYEDVYTRVVAERRPMEHLCEGAKALNNTSMSA